MTIRELLTTTAHRPWKIPNNNWKFYQEWNNALIDYAVEMGILSETKSEKELIQKDKKNITRYLAF